MTPPPRPGCKGSFPEAGPNWAEARLDATAGVAHRTFARREDPGYRREGQAQFHNHPPPHSKDFHWKWVEYSYTQSGYYSFFNCLHTFSKLCLFFFQNSNPRIAHTKCKMPHISCKMKHCIQNITNTVIKSVLKSKHLSYVVNTFAIILQPELWQCWDVF